MQGMRDLLRGSLRRSLRELTALDRLSAAWPVACGTVLAVRGEIEALNPDNVLLIRVESAQWMQPFLAARAMLTSEVANIAGVPVSEIHFYLNSNTQARAVAAASTLPSTPPGEKH